MALIIIRRLIGGAVFVAGCYLVENEIGVTGCFGVAVMIIGLGIVAGLKGYFCTASSEHKSKKEEHITN